MLKTLKLTNHTIHSQELLINYLQNSLKDGKKYFKSRYIARDLGMSPKEVGTAMKFLSEVYDGLTIVPWSYSKSTTWYVEKSNTT